MVESRAGHKLVARYTELQHVKILLRDSRSVRVNHDHTRLIEAQQANQRMLLDAVDERRHSNYRADANNNAQHRQQAAAAVGVELNRVSRESESINPS